jgi:hypothetical protein
MFVFTVHRMSCMVMPPVAFLPYAVPARLQVTLSAPLQAYKPAIGSRPKETQLRGEGAALVIYDRFDVMVVGIAFSCLSMVASARADNIRNFQVSCLFAIT